MISALEQAQQIVPCSPHKGFCFLRCLFLFSSSLLLVTSPSYPLLIPSFFPILPPLSFLPSFPFFLSFFCLSLAHLLSAPSLHFSARLCDQESDFLNQRDTESEQICVCLLFMRKRNLLNAIFFLYLLTPFSFLCKQNKIFTDQFTWPRPHISFRSRIKISFLPRILHFKPA